MEEQEMKTIRKIIFIPTSLFLWFLYAYYTLERPCNPDYCGPQMSVSSAILLALLLAIYTYPVFKFLIKKFNLKARWFFYYFLVSATIILLSEVVPFLDNLEYNDAYGLFAVLLIGSCGLSLIFSIFLWYRKIFTSKTNHK